MAPGGRMKHRRRLLTDRQRLMVVVMNVAGLAYALVGIAQLAFGHWTGLVGLACSAGILVMSRLAHGAYLRRNAEALHTAIMAHDRDPNCPCPVCEDSGGEGYDQHAT